MNAVNPRATRPFRAAAAAVFAIDPRLLTAIAVTLAAYIAAGFIFHEEILNMWHWITGIWAAVVGIVA